MRIRCLIGVFFLLTPAVYSADVTAYIMAKSQHYQQTNSSAPLILSTGGYGFTATVLSTNAFSVTNATIQSPGTLSLQTLTPATNGLSLTYSLRTNTQGQLDALCPSGLFGGDYTFRLFTVNDGTRTSKLNFALNSWPNLPTVLNYPAAQVIDHSRAFTISWSSSSSSTLDFVQVLIADANSNAFFASPFLTTGALNGVSNSCTIPPNTLPAGSNLTGHLVYFRPGLPNTNTYPGATGVGAFVRDISFSMITRPAPAEPTLYLTNFPVPGANVQLVGETGRVHRIEASSDFNTWTCFATSTTPNGLMNVIETDALNWSSRFYRAFVGE